MNWAEFQQKHVLDPSLDPSYYNWDRSHWNEWFRSRLPSGYGTKTINSVIVSPPESILADFRDRSSFGVKIL
jgi:hypothetical protein